MRFFLLHFLTDLYMSKIFPSLPGVYLSWPADLHIASSAHLSFSALNLRQFAVFRSRSWKRCDAKKKTKTIYEHKEHDGKITEFQLISFVEKETLQACPVQWTVSSKSHSWQWSVEKGALRSQKGRKGRFSTETEAILISNLTGFVEKVIKTQAPKNL